MEPLPAVAPWGELTEACTRQAVAAWQLQYGSRREDECDVWLALSSVECQTTIFNGGRATAIVLVRSKRKWEDASYMFRLARRGPGEWTVKGNTLPSE